mmetsp:Transcript_52052/g.97690  ORF Transcript_52052/g.97690 Transcript_52052/m.97690 type:complete len:414 (-) Transcript_52052:72-1313(-)
MSGCGLKNSKCRSTTPAPNGHEHESDGAHLNSSIDSAFPFQFVDGDTGLWSTAISHQSSSLICPFNSSLVLHYPRGTEDVVQLQSRLFYDRCDMTESQVLSPPTYEDLALVDGQEGDGILFTMPDVTYYYRCDGAINSTVYISSSMPGHCQAGQKIAVQIVASPHSTQEVIDVSRAMHADSLQSLFTLLGARNEPETGFLIMDRGYQTEELAHQTEDWIWCGMDHCPRTAQDVWNDATMEDCKSALHLLLGFLNRKRPIPRWTKAEHYYRLAIGGDTAGVNSIQQSSTAANGSKARRSRNECAARGYLTKMFLDKGELDKASKEALQLCSRCGAEDGYGNNDDALIALRQAKHEFDILAANGIAVQWPNYDACANILPDLTANSAPSHHHSFGALLAVQVVFFFHYLFGFCTR